MDGIDVAIIETDGQQIFDMGPAQTFPYDVGLRQRLQDVLTDPSVAEREPLSELEIDVTHAHAGAVTSFASTFTIDLSSVDIIGLHGQTIFHRPERRFTRQLLDGKLAAKQLGVDVVYRFRHADIAAGGHGAPLVPLYHQALAAKLPQPLMVLNLGGVGNVTYIDGDVVIAFDTGPASALLDDFMVKRRGLPFDDGGTLARAGQVHQDLVAAFMTHPFFRQPAPKSLDRNDFHGWASSVDKLSDADGAATLSAFTVAATVASLAHVPRLPARWLIAGGGRLNHTFMEGLTRELGMVDPVESVGWNGDAIEAQCFGFLAVRSLLGLPLSLPTTTGAPRPMSGGERARAS